MGYDERGRASYKKSLTKQEALDFINDNKIQIEEMKYSLYGEGLIDEVQALAE